MDPIRTLENLSKEDAQRAAAVEVIRREALRSGRTVRRVLSLIRVSNPVTGPEQLLLAAVEVLEVPHAVVPHKCESVEEWIAHCRRLGLVVGG
jgi:hypothetical protein